MNDDEGMTQALEKIYAAARPNAVFGPPTESNGYTVITASEVVSTGGFGYGKSQAEDARGGGGGGFSMARPVAVVIIGPDGVKVKPVVDATKVALAGVTAWAAIALNAMRIFGKARS